MPQCLILFPAPLFKFSIVFVAIALDSGEVGLFVQIFIQQQRVVPNILSKIFACSSPNDFFCQSMLVLQRLSSESNQVQELAGIMVPVLTCWDRR